MVDIRYDLDPADWDNYAGSHLAATFSHFHGWVEALAETYGHDFYMLAAVRGRRIIGLVPLIHFAAPGRERRLISLPYTDAAGIVADDEEAGVALVQAALGLAESLGASHLELRQARGAENFLTAACSGWTIRAHTFKIGMSRRLPSCSDDLWRLLVPKARNQVRKARKSGCSIEYGGIELVESFYLVFAENMRDLGSPVHAFDLLRRTASNLAARVFVIFFDQLPVAAAMVFSHGRTLCNPWAASLRRLRPLCPNMLLYWTMLAYGADNGFVQFDFGRSTPDASTCRFKQQWGAKMEPLTWYSFSKPGEEWDPRWESLENGHWRELDLDTACRRGPAIRRWISL